MMMRLQCGIRPVASLLFAFLLLLVGFPPLYAAPASGDYLYQGKSGSELVHYRMHPVLYHGIRAREVVWEDHRMIARHVLGANDGKPLYMSRVDKQGGSHIEVIYHRPTDGVTYFTSRNAATVIEQETRAAGAA